jgi:gamma-tubulin complex component 5
LLEKFYVLNNQPLAAALKPRLDELASIPNKWRPELLALLLALSDRPAEKITNIDRALNIVPNEPVEQQLTWAEIIADDPFDEEGIWDDVEYESDYSEHRAASLSDESVGEPSTSTSASSLDEEDPATLARAFVTPKDHGLLDQVKDLRDRMTSMHSGSELTELQVIRQVLLMLHGLPTDLFELGGSGCFQTRHSCRLANIAPSTLDRVLHDLALLGSQVMTVRRFVTSDQQSVVLQSFQAAVQTRLSEFGRTLSDIEQVFLQQDKSAVVSILNVHAEVDRVARPLVRLGGLIPDKAPKHNVRALQLLNNLFQQACNLQLIGEDEESATVAALLSKCLEPYLRPVRLWMTEGKLIASNELFFVRCLDESSDRGSIWHSRFTLLRQADGSIFAPLFMQSLAERIFRAGKSVMFLEALGQMPDVSRCKAQNLDITQIMQSTSNTLLPFSEIFKLALICFIDALEGSETLALRQILTTQCGLQTTISAINHLYFGVNGAHFQNFAYGIFQRMDRGIGWDDRFLLTELAQTAFETVDAVMSDHIIIRVKPHSGKNAAMSHGGRADMLGRIVVDYSVSRSIQANNRLDANQEQISWALQNVLKRATLAICQQAYTIMLRLYRAQYLLHQQEWTLNIMANRPKDRRVKELLALRQHLSWFVTTLKGYVCEVTSIVTKQLTVDLEATADVDGIVAAFDTFQLNLASKLLQHENLAPIQESILATLELYEDLALEWRDAVKQISNQASQPTPRQLIVQQGFSARRDRPEIDETADLTDDEDDEDTHGHHNQRSVLSVPGLLKEYKRQLSFLLAGLRSVSRIEGEPAWIMLSERLSWGVSGTERK